jgi:hypothetical protein
MAGDFVRGVVLLVGWVARVEKDEEVSKVSWLSVEEPKSSFVFPLGTTVTPVTRWDGFGSRAKRGEWRKQWQCPSER